MNMERERERKERDHGSQRICRRHSPENDGYRRSRRRFVPVCVQLSDCVSICVVIIAIHARMSRVRSNCYSALVTPNSTSSLFPSKSFLLRCSVCFVLFFNAAPFGNKASECDTMLLYYDDAGLFSIRLALLVVTFLLWLLIFQGSVLADNADINSNERVLIRKPNTRGNSTSDKGLYCLSIVCLAGSIVWNCDAMRLFDDQQVSFILFR